jgi:hypothetical protein
MPDRGGFQAFAVPRDEYEVPAVTRQAGCECGADARSGSGDERDGHGRSLLTRAPAAILTAAWQVSVA